MKAQHRGYTIEVQREKCMAGYDLLYTTIVRDSDLYVALELAEDTAETVRDQVRYMKQRIDAELEEDDPWCEREGFADYACVA